MSNISAAVVNVEYIEAAAFLTVILFDKHGEQSDSVIKPVVDEASAVTELIDILDFHKVTSFQTSTRALFSAFIQTPGYIVEMLPSAETSVTKAAIKTYETELREIYSVEMKTRGMTLKATGWRKWAIKLLRKLTEGYSL